MLKGYCIELKQSRTAKICYLLFREPPAAIRRATTLKASSAARALGAHFLSIRPLNRRGSVYLKVIARNQPVVVAGAVLGYAKTTG